MVRAVKGLKTADFTLTSGTQKISMKLPGRYKDMEISVMPGLNKNLFKETLTSLVKREGFLCLATELPESTNAYKIKRVPVERLLNMKKVHFFNSPLSEVTFRDSGDNMVYLSQTNLEEKGTYTFNKLYYWFKGVNPNKVMNVGHELSQTNPLRFIEEPLLAA